MSPRNRRHFSLSQASVAAIRAVFQSPRQHSEARTLGKWRWALLLFVLPSLSVASGFAIFVQGASTLGEGLASTAHGNNPEVIFYNPALMNSLDGTQVQNGVTFVLPNHEFDSNLTGGSHRTDRAVFFPGTLYLTHKVDEKLSVGLGVFTPFGLGTKWDDNWEGRYVVTEVEMTTFNFNPVVSYQLTPSMSLAAGIDVLYVNAILKNKVNFAAFGFSDGTQKFSGDGVGVGFNLGFHAKLRGDLAFGLSFRSEIETDLDGDAEFGLPSSTLAPTFPNSTAATSITFPAQLHAALAYSGFERVVIEVGVRWEGWSSYDQLKFKTAKPVLGSNTQIRPTDWHDTWTLTMGGRYRLNDSTRLLAGLILGEDPIPDRTFEPSITDAPHWSLTAGMERSIGKHTLGLSYAYQRWLSRSKNNSVGAEFAGGTVADARANGRYRSDSHFFAASFTYVF
jgi:long-chain fatty acid transport protein